MGQIWIIEDEEIVYNTLKRILKVLGYSSIISSSGAEVKQHLDKTEDKIDYIFLDLQLPDINGIDLLELIRTKYPNLKIIICSGLISEEQKKSMEIYEIYSILEKPFSIEELRAIIN